MSKAKKTEVKEKNIESLKNDLLSKRNELFKARMDHMKRNLKNTSTLSNIRHDIARILTALHGKSVENGVKEVKNG